MTDEKIWKYAMGVSISRYAKKLGKPTAEDLASEAYEVFCRRTNGTEKRSSEGYVRHTIPLILKERILKRINDRKRMDGAAEGIANILENGSRVNEEAEKARAELIDVCNMLSNKGKSGKTIASRIKVAMDNEIVSFSRLADHLGVSRQAINQGLRYARMFL